MRNPREYKQQLKEIHIAHNLALEQAEESFPLFKNNKNNKAYERNYDNDNMNLQEIDSRLEELQKTIKQENNKLSTKIDELNSELDNKKELYEKMNSKDGGYDDTERALIEMKKHFKILQTNTFIKAFDLSLGIIIVSYLIYKKSK